MTKVKYTKNDCEVTLEVGVGAEREEATAKMEEQGWSVVEKGIKVTSSMKKKYRTASDRGETYNPLNDRED